MRPHDIVVLLQLLLSKDRITQTEISARLHLSQSEISESMRRSELSGLLLPDGQQVSRKSLRDFLVYGVRFVFPVRPGPVVTGLPTAQSAPPLISIFSSSSEKYVWPDDFGTERGQAIAPLYDALPKAVRNSPDLYALCAIVDALRLGDARLRKYAIQALDQYL